MKQLSVVVKKVLFELFFAVRVLDAVYHLELSILCARLSCGQLLTASCLSFLKRLLPLKAMEAMSRRNEAGRFAAPSSRQPAVAQESGGGQKQQDEN